MTNLFAIILDKEEDVYGNSLNHKGHVIAICHSDECAKEVIRKINRNPYFGKGTSLRVVVYELNKDHSGYSNYPLDDATTNSQFLTS